MKDAEISLDARKALGRAIAALRDKLGWTQTQMARELGAKHDRYVQWWEAGEHFPGGKFILKMLQLCPDAESLAAFGIDVQNVLGTKVLSTVWEEERTINAGTTRKRRKGSSATTLKKTEDGKTHI